MKLGKPITQIVMNGMPIERANLMC